MEENKYLIFLKDINQTKEIKTIRNASDNDQMYEVKFGDEKLYKYNAENVKIFKNPQTINIEQKAIFIEKLYTEGIIRILDFGEYTRVEFNNREPMIYSSDKIEYKENVMLKQNPKKVLDYWKEISKYVLIGDEKESFLYNQYKDLDLVMDDSVLGNYLEKANFEIKPFNKNEIIFPFRFNMSQKKALENALKSKISIIKGPPGTGKTQTILNIIANIAIMQSKSVAVISGNNAAIQNIKDKMDKCGYGYFVASLGSRDNKINFFESEVSINKDITVNEISENKLLEKIQELNTKIDDIMHLNNKSAIYKQNLNNYLTEQKHFNMYYEKQDIEKIKTLSFYNKTPERIIAFLAEYNIMNALDISFNLLKKIKFFFKYGLTDYKMLKEKDIDIVLNLQREYYKLKVSELVNEINKMEKELRENSFEKLLNEHETVSKHLFDRKLQTRFENMDNTKFNIKSYKRNYEKFIERFPIVLSTTYSLKSCAPQNYLFDYLIIDEASQVDLLSSGLALSCCKNAIIVGDEKQLPQIVDNTIRKKIKKTDIEEPYDYFHNSILTSMINLFGNKINMIMLNEHYRCHPKIINFCNIKYYNNQLIPFTEEKQVDEPLVIIKTTEGNHMREVTKGEKKGKYNQRELDSIVYEFINNPDVATVEYKSIGFMTPYRKQVEKANDTLFGEIECDTIHKYQGREKAIMILSTVLSNTYQGKVGMSFVDDPCKINVAVSRAIEKFILVTDGNVFNKYSNEVADLIKYIEYNTFDKNIIKSDVVSVFDLLYKEYSSKLDDFKKNLLNVSRFKSEDIIATLINNIIKLDEYSSFTFICQIFIKNLIIETERLSEKEKKYVNNNASVDFVVYYKFDKSPALVVEVDGFANHENNPVQKERDKLKDSILDKYGIPLIRLKSNRSGEEAILKQRLDAILDTKS
jgi:superfamily I DNA and/or RNA helicase